MSMGYNWVWDITGSGLHLGMGYNRVWATTVGIGYNWVWATAWYGLQWAWTTTGYGLQPMVGKVTSFVNG